MKQYSTLPVVVEAVQWDGSVDHAKEIISWIGNNGKVSRFEEVGSNKWAIRIHTHPSTGYSDCRSTDWIVIGPEKNISVVPNHVFLITYGELVGT